MWRCIFIKPTSLSYLFFISGDALLQKLLRHKAKKLGMCLNEYGMGEAYGKADLVRDCLLV